MSRPAKKPETEPSPFLRDADPIANAVYHVMLMDPNVKVRRKAKKVLRKWGFGAQVEKIDVVPQRPALLKERPRRVQSEKQRLRGLAFIAKKKAEREQEGNWDREGGHEGLSAARLPYPRPTSPTLNRDRHSALPQISQPTGVPPVLKGPTKLPPLPEGQRYVFRFPLSGITCEGKARTGAQVKITEKGGRCYDDSGREVVVIDVAPCPPRKEWEPAYKFDEDFGQYVQPPFGVPQSNFPVKVEPTAPQFEYRPINPVELSPLIKPAKPLGACPNRPRVGMCPPGSPTCTGWCGR